MNRKRRSNSQPGDNYNPMADAQMSRRSPTSLTRKTSEVVACIDRGRMTPEERKHRAKLILWPFISDHKAARCEPRTGPRELDAARRLCGVRDTPHRASTHRASVRVEHYPMPIAA